ncbi:hypothetical protein GBAR_LOCUS21229 [Geodia barretti]|jgi:hypothetical protein|uniref:Uncharacterized protein n=1 Tax=Geodia barretti TaxID=519541 RepID=A0AA35X533_GEOBA|nr:hypothetical protein GBAR_LOCUS21229 [Geodia barretti]
MLGFILLSLVAAGIGIAQGLVKAESTPVVHGTCGSGGCYVEMEGPHGGQETRFIRLDQQISGSNDPCHIYQCTTRGVIEDRLECGPIITCQDGSQPIGFPDTCCPRCIGIGSRQHEVCSFTQWSEWGRCSVPCGGGRRACVRHPVHLSESAISIYCSGSLTEIQECNTYACPGNLPICSTNDTFLQLL